jgi:hypothetical protein
MNVVDHNSVQKVVVEVDPSEQLSPLLSGVTCASPLLDFYSLLDSDEGFSSSEGGGAGRDRPLALDAHALHDELEHALRAAFASPHKAALKVHKGATLFLGSELHASQLFEWPLLTAAQRNQLFGAVLALVVFVFSGPRVWCTALVGLAVYAFAVKNRSHREKEIG